VLVLDGHERAVFSVSWGVGKEGSGTDEGEYLGWLASTGSDGAINVWELSVSVAVSVWFALLLMALQESLESDNNSPPVHNLIAHVPCAHSVYDVNAISWCPRKGYENILATVGDDGIARIWRVLPA
jgi:cytosolic iron-sulfur protein assembly protein CIAO1